MEIKSSLLLSICLLKEKEVKFTRHGYCQANRTKVVLFILLIAVVFFLFSLFTTWIRICWIFLEVLAILFYPL